MRLLQDRILVKPIKKETENNGIILPESTQDKNIGEVLIVSDKCKAITVGDTVKFYQHSGIPVRHQETDCLIMKESSDVIAIL